MLVSRHGAASEEAAQKIRQIREHAAVHVCPTDVSNEAEVRRLFERIDDAMPPLRGIFHCAMVLDDGALLNLNEKRFATVMAPKVDGALLLHTYTRQFPLDWFVCFSSISSLVGNAGQGNYVAANAFLDTFAHYRRALGLPAITVNLGVLADVGVAARSESLGETFTRAGIRGFHTEAVEVPERCYHVDLFPEYQELQQQFVMLEQLDIANPYCKVNEGVVADTTMIDGREYLSYAGYNYLGFSGDPRVSDAVKKAVGHYGTSASASRVATGERPLHRELEQELADLLGTEDCLIFVSGYGTNVTVIGHLFGAKDLILHDELSHSSILNGSLLSAARRIPFPHNDVDALEQILQENRSQYERVLVVIEGVYSMDGDIADLPGCIGLRNRYKTLLMVDEAHSIGVLGDTGRGIGEHFDVVLADVDLWMER